MQTNGHYYDDHHAPARYDGFDESGYDSPESSRASAQWKQPAAVNGGPYHGFDFDTQIGSRTSHQISLDTHMRSHNGDAVGQHLLYETALLDAEHYEILDINEVDTLKEEYTRLNSRIDAANRKLLLESKLKDAAQNLQRLYTSKKDGRPDTPQSPDSPKRTRNSLLGRTRAGSGATQFKSSQQAADELAQSIKAVDELNETIKSLMERRSLVEGRLIKHTAAVLADQAQRVKEPVDSVLTHGHSTLQGLDVPGYEPSEFDSIRDILHGGSSGGGSKLVNGEEAASLRADYDQHLQNMQDRLEQLNTQLRKVIGHANELRGAPIPSQPQPRYDGDATTNVGEALDQLEQSMQAFEVSHEQSHAEIEEQLHKVNTQLYRSLPTEAQSSLREPPQLGGQSSQEQMQYLGHGLAALEKIAPSIQRTEEYETVLSGLWGIIASDSSSPRGSVADGASHGALAEDFSLPAFNSRVQHLFNSHTAAKEQQDILRRQIQQQRDLNGKSDMEKDREIAELQNKHDELTGSHNAMQDELAKVMFKHQEAEKQATESRAELDNVMSEFEQLQTTLNTRMKDLEVHRTNAATYQQQVASLEAQIDDMSSSFEEHEQLEAEVVRLTTELTIAKAELEASYGTRAERQKEAGRSESEVEALREAHRKELAGSDERRAAVERELEAMAGEFQDLTRESLALEKERGQLESLIDGLRDRVDALEGQLSDEKVRWIGMQSPRSDAIGSNSVSKEATSMVVLRQEFKKMMREARAEGVKLLRAEQEERRRLETEMRKNRQTNGPLGKHLANSERPLPTLPQLQTTES